jgi:uncharacterized protein (DUF302 family)
MTMTTESQPRVPLGVVTKASAQPFDITLQRLEDELSKRGLTLVAKVDHAAAAEQVGLVMPPTVVLIFGNPRVGTPLMLETPLLALDLPLKLLVHEDAAGQTWVSCDAPGYLADRYGIPATRATGISGVSALVAAALDH